MSSSPRGVAPRCDVGNLVSSRHHGPHLGDSSGTLPSPPDVSQAPSYTVLTMTRLDAIFETFPGTTYAGHPLPITLRVAGEHNPPHFVTDEGFLQALYRGDFTFCVRGKFTYVRNVRYTIGDLSRYLPPCQIVRAVENPSRLDVLARGDQWWTSITVWESSCFVDVGGDSFEQCHELLSRLRSGLETRDNNKKLVSFDVWSMAGPPVSRKFDEVPWHVVAENYPVTTRTNLSRLMTMSRAQVTTGGKIIVFHGLPGTGKTWAIRSLLTSWKGWAHAALVIDPDALLSSPEYFLSIFQSVNEGTVRLLILEDADQIVEKNGTRSNDLSRLLNLTDGLVGASSDVAVLLSTNARAASLDSALLRPGRCLASVSFEPFTAFEASERIGRSVTSPHTLAQIFEATGAVERLSNETLASIGQYL